VVYLCSLKAILPLNFEVPTTRAISVPLLLKSLETSQQQSKISLMSPTIRQKLNILRA